MGDLQTFDKTVSAREVASSITEHGYAIIHSLLSSEELNKLSGQLAPHLNSIDLGDPDPFFGHKTKRFGALLRRCPMTRGMVMDDLVLGIADLFLGPYCVRYQLNYTGVMYLAPGETHQSMHRDTGFYPIQNPAPPLTLATMWAVSDFTSKNGATRIVPGSHLWTDDRKPSKQEITQAEMPAGSVMVYSGGLIHGGGANKSDNPRCGLALHYSLGWLRQEENQYMAIPPKEAKTYPKKLQRLMGYDLATVNLGFVDHKHPNDVLNGTAGKDPGILGPEEMMNADNAVKRFKVTEASAVGRTRIDK